MLEIPHSDPTDWTLQAPPHQLWGGARENQAQRLTREGPLYYTPETLHIKEHCFLGPSQTLFPERPVNGESPAEAGQEPLWVDCPHRALQFIQLNEQNLYTSLDSELNPGSLARQVVWSAEGCLAGGSSVELVGRQLVLPSGSRSREGVVGQKTQLSGL